MFLRELHIRRPQRLVRGLVMVGLRSVCAPVRWPLRLSCSLARIQRFPLCMALSSPGLRWQSPSQESLPPSGTSPWCSCGGKCPPESAPWRVGEHHSPLLTLVIQRMHLSRQGQPPQKPLPCGVAPRSWIAPADHWKGAEHGAC